MGSLRMTGCLGPEWSSFCSQQGALLLSLEFRKVYKYYLLSSLPEILLAHETRNTTARSTPSQ